MGKKTFHITSLSYIAKLYLAACDRVFFAKFVIDTVLNWAFECLNKDYYAIISYDLFSYAQKLAK